MNQEGEIWYVVERSTPRNGHWYRIYGGTSEGEARFALWNAVKGQSAGLIVRIREEVS